MLKPIFLVSYFLFCFKRGYQALFVLFAGAKVVKNTHTAKPIGKKSEILLPNLSFIHQDKYFVMSVNLNKSETQTEDCSPVSEQQTRDI